MRAPRVLGLVVTAGLGVTACSGEVPLRTTGPTTDGVGLTVPVTEPPPPEPMAEPPSPTTVPPAPAGHDAAVGELPDGEATVVEDVVDGDTIVVAGGIRVRLIGVDTPETKDPRKAVQCFGVEASAHTMSLLGSRTPVRLVYDVERFDRFGRTLAYVYREGDGLFVNAALVAEGYAQVAAFPPNVAHAEELIRLARSAREDGRGLWSACEEGPAEEPPAQSGSATANPPAEPSRAGPCDASYPDVCIPPAPPDLDCGNIDQRRFRVLPPDPHRFDGSDDDGLGCEG